MEIGTTVQGRGFNLSTSYYLIEHKNINLNTTDILV
jgi:hypothetical protein